MAGENHKHCAAGSNHRATGAKYEKLAAAYLTDKGYELLECNYATKYSEIDLILKDRATLVFCEVKYRSSNHYGSPLEAVDIRKQRRISKAAMHYYITHGCEADTPCRFDVIAIYGDGQLEHIENAFDYCG